MRLAPKTAIRATAAVVLFAALMSATHRIRAERDIDPALTIFHADSLAAYMDGLANAFETSHRGVNVRKEGTGSLDAIRRVTDLHLPCDILVTADWRLLTKARPGIARWTIVFAGNSMGLLYTDKSREASSISPGNWYDVLMRKGVRYGHSNPERDPAGYWTLVMWQLAQRYYRIPGPAQRLDDACPAANIRPKSVDLIALLQSGELDYYFGYASDARLGNLKFVALPPEINLGDFNRVDAYSRASVLVGSAGKRKQIVGAPIAYGLTMTADPPNREAAIEFIKMILGEAGKRAASDHGLIPYPTAYALDPDSAMPPELHPLTQPLPANLR